MTMENQTFEDVFPIKLWALEKVSLPLKMASFLVSMLNFWGVNGFLGTS